jgi:hypothetical protein
VLRIVKHVGRCERLVVNSAPHNSSITCVGRASKSSKILRTHVPDPSPTSPYNNPPQHISGSGICPRLRREITHLGCQCMLHVGLRYLVMVVVLVVPKLMGRIPPIRCCSGRNHQRHGNAQTVTGANMSPSYWTIAGRLTDTAETRKRWHHGLKLDGVRTCGFLRWWLQGGVLTATFCD